MKEQTTQLLKNLFKNSHNPRDQWLLLKKAIDFSTSKTSDLSPSSVATIARSLVAAKMFPELDDLRRLIAASNTGEKAQHCLYSLFRVLIDSGLSEKAISHFKALRSQFPEKVHSVRLYNDLLDSSFRRRDLDSLSWLYEDMVGSGVEPTAYSCNVLIRALCDSGNLEDARHVFDKMHLKGCVPNEFSVGILVQGYCRAGLGDRALELLDEERTGVKPNQVIYNTIVSFLCRQGRTEEAEKLVEKMTERNIFPNVETFNARISAFCKSGKILEASRIFRDMSTDTVLGFPKPNNITHKLMFHGFCRVGMLEEARMLFDSMKTEPGLLKLQSYNVWLTYLIRNGELMEAQSLLKEIVDKGLEPSTCTYNIILNGLCKNGMFSDARMVMGLMISSGVSVDTITYTSLLQGYCNKGRVLEANKVLKEMMANNCHPNTVTCNILLRSLWKEGRISEAEELLIKMKERDYGVDAYTCNTVIEGLINNGKLDKAIEIAEDMWSRGSEALEHLGGIFVGLFGDCKNVKDCRPDMFTYTTIISGLCKAGKINEAKNKLVEMIDKKLQPDTRIFNSFILSYCKEGKISSAFKVLKDMEKKGCKKDLQTYNSLILGLGLKSQIFEIYGLLDEMRENGISPDVHTYNNTISCLCEGDKVKDAASLLDEMVQKGVSPNIATFKLLIAAFSKACEFRDLEEVFEIALSVCGHREALYSSMFNGCLSAEEVLKAKTLLKDALKRNIDIGNFRYKDLIEKLCNDDELEEANSIIHNIMEKGIEFDPAIFLPVIDGLGKKGKKLEADLLTDKLLEMDSEVPVKSKERRHKNERCPRSSVKTEESDWKTKLNRDDGSVDALNTLKKVVQQGWGRQRISDLLKQNDERP